MNILLLATEFDTPYIPRFQPLLATHACKLVRQPMEFLGAIAARVKLAGIDSIICTCPITLVTLLQTQSDFRHPVDKRGSKRKLALDDYAGSFFTIPAHKLNHTKDVDVLILNPLAQLVSTPEGPFVFKRFVSKITAPNSWFPQTPFTFQVWTAADSQKLINKFASAILISVDIETYVGDPERRIHCVGYCGLWADGSTHSVVVPFKDMLGHGFVREVNSNAVAKIMQNGMYDNLYFLRWNVPCTNYLYDTQHLFHSWYSELPKRLDFITAFTVRKIRFWKDDASAGSEHDLFEYNARDCWATLHAWAALITEVPDWAKTNYLMEFPLVFPCLHQEADGLSLDHVEFERRKLLAENALAVQAKKLAAWFGLVFNPASPVQCKNLLGVLGMKNVESADSKTMIACAAVHPFNELIISSILAYRKQAKLLSTYFKWDKFWNGRLHARTNPAGTDTGRLASTESSFWTGLQIQNIPQGAAVKSWIVADTGWKLAENDYAQSESRCVGYISGCTSLIDLVESDKDFHKWNASAFFGIPYDQVDKPLRNLAKRVNHGAGYGMGAQVMLDTMGPKMVAEARILLKLPAKWTLVQVCQHLLKTYETTYPEVKRDWCDAIRREIALTKKLKSPLGWTRYFFNDPVKSKQAMNAAIAHAPQNLSVTIINKVFYRIWHDTIYGDLRGKMSIKAQIHDSIFYEYNDDTVPALVGTRMQLPVDIKDCHGKVRNMLIPNDCSHGGLSWAALK